MTRESLETSLQTPDTQPSHVSTWLEIGNLYFKANDYEMAERYHRKAAYGLDASAYKHREERVRSLVNLGQTLRSWSRADEAELVFQDAVDIVPDSPLALILLSVARRFTTSLQKIECFFFFYSDNTYVQVRRFASGNDSRHDDTKCITQLRHKFM